MIKPEPVELYRLEHLSQPFDGTLLQDAITPCDALRTMMAVKVSNNSDSSSTFQHSIFMNYFARVFAIGKSAFIRSLSALSTLSFRSP